MNLLVVILKKADLVTEICKELAEEGVHGGSILSDDDEQEIVKVMLFVMNDEETEEARKTIQRVVGLDEPNTGIMFAVPVSFVEGLGA